MLYSDMYSDMYSDDADNTYDTYDTDNKFDYQLYQDNIVLPGLSNPWWEVSRYLDYYQLDPTCIEVMVPEVKEYRTRSLYPTAVRNAESSLQVLSRKNSDNLLTTADGCVLVARVVVLIKGEYFESWVSMVTSEDRGGLYQVRIVFSCNIFTALGNPKGCE